MSTSSDVEGAAGALAALAVDAAAAAAATGASGGASALLASSGNGAPSVQSGAGAGAGAGASASVAPALPPEHRFYEQPFPEVDELVVVRVNKIAEMGAYVSLLEYGNREGMILFSELSRVRIRSINKLIRVGRVEVAVVLRVDKDKGYIDLSKRRVTPEDAEKCEERYNKSKAVHSIIRHVAELVPAYPVEYIYEQVGWPLYRRYGHAFDAFNLVVHSDQQQQGAAAGGAEPAVDIFSGMDVPPELRDALIDQVRQRMTPQPVRLRADIEVSCFSYEGVEGVRRALKAGEACGTDAHPIKSVLVAPPLYVLTTQTLKKDEGLDCLRRACAAIEAAMRTCHGRVVVKEPPRAVSERDERQLALAMENAEAANRELSGDDDDSSDDEDGDAGAS